MMMQRDHTGNENYAREHGTLILMCEFISKCSEQMSNV